MKRPTAKNNAEHAPSYPVGYKKPPAEHRFKKGVSGNPSGRRRAVPSVPDGLRAQLLRRIAVRENGGPRRWTTAIEAVLGKAIADALQGRGHKPLVDLLKILQATGLLSLEEVSYPMNSNVTVTIVRPHDKAPADYKSPVHPRRKSDSD